MEKRSTRTGENLRRLRGKATQLQMSMDLPIAKSTVSAYEVGRRELPADISKLVMNKWDDPQYAIDVANEYTANGWVPWLNGPAFDGHRSSVKDKVLEEITEAVEALGLAKLNKHPDYLTNFERDDLEKSLEEAAEAITALNIYIATICKDYGFSWLKLWENHRVELISKKYLSKESLT